MYVCVCGWGSAQMARQGVLHHSSTRSPNLLSIFLSPSSSSVLLDVEPSWRRCFFWDQRQNPHSNYLSNSKCQQAHHSFISPVFLSFPHISFLQSPASLVHQTLKQRRRIFLKHWDDVAKLQSFSVFLWFAAATNFKKLTLLGKVVNETEIIFVKCRNLKSAEATKTWIFALFCFINTYLGWPHLLVQGWANYDHMWNHIICITKVEKKYFD